MTHAHGVCLTGDKEHPDLCVPEKSDANKIPEAIRANVPIMFTRKTQIPVAKVLPRPLFLMKNWMRRSNDGARLIDRANRGTLKESGRRRPSRAQSDLNNPNDTRRSSTSVTCHALHQWLSKVTASTSSRVKNCTAILRRAANAVQVIEQMKA